MNTVIHALWVGDDQSPLIMPGSIPLGDRNVNAELTQYLQDSWKAIIDADVDGPNSEPARIDKDKPLFGQRSLTKRLARTVFFGAAPTIGCCAQGPRAPARVPRHRDPRRRARATSTPRSPRSATARPTSTRRSGKYWYDLQANITRRAKDQAERLHDEDVCRRSPRDSQRHTRDPR